MAKARTEKLIIGGTEYRLRWDMHAIATVEELTGINAFDGIAVSVRNIRAVLWAAIDAAAAHADEDCPIAIRKIGGHFENEDDIAKAIRVMTRLIGMPEQEAANPPEAPTVKRSRSRAATRSPESTSASASATSGA